MALHSVTETIRGFWSNKTFIRQMVDLKDSDDNFEGFVYCSWLKITGKEFVVDSELSSEVKVGTHGSTFKDAVEAEMTSADAEARSKSLTIEIKSMISDLKGSIRAFEDFEGIYKIPDFLVISGALATLQDILEEGGNGFFGPQPSMLDAMFYVIFKRLMMSDHEPLSEIADDYEVLVNLCANFFVGCYQ